MAARLPDSVARRGTGHAVSVVSFAAVQSIAFRALNMTVAVGVLPRTGNGDFRGECLVLTEHQRGDRVSQNERRRSWPTLNDGALEVLVRSLASPA